MLRGLSFYNQTHILASEMFQCFCSLMLPCYSLSRPFQTKLHFHFFNFYSLRFKPPSSSDCTKHGPWKGTDEWLHAKTTFLISSGSEKIENLANISLWFQQECLPWNSERMKSTNKMYGTKCKNGVIKFQMTLLRPALAHDNMNDHSIDFLQMYRDRRMTLFLS